MLKKVSFIKTEPGKFIFLILTALIFALLVFMTILLFPVKIFDDTPKTHVVKGSNGYVILPGRSEISDWEIFKLRGEWEFYPGKLYSFNDFTTGRTGEPRLVEFPHFWKNEPAEVINKSGYATYRMRVRVPQSFSGIGLYSRFQYSSYEVFLNDISICGSGVVSEDLSEYKPVYLPTNGYTFAAIGSEGRTFSVILHVQNDLSDSGGFANDIFIGSATSVKNLRTFLVMLNGFVSGSLLLLFICFLLIYLNGRERTEYLDYTIVSLAALFISLTNGGESLMYSIGIDSLLLVRLECCAFIFGAFFANYSFLKSFIQSKLVFRIIYLYMSLATIFFLFAPLAIPSIVRISIISLSSIFFLLPLYNSLKNSLLNHDLTSIVSLFSYMIIYSGIGFYLFGEIPWDSVDVLSISILIYCLLQMLMFLHRYRKIEQSLKDMTETLEERIDERTAELTLMKEKAEASTLAKSNFLATMSHEIRTPMNAIMGISTLMRTDNLDEIQLNYLTDIKRSSKALLQIINDILDFSKIEAGKLEIIPAHFDLMTLYDNICSLCHFSASAKNLKFTHSFAPEVPRYILDDEIRYRQIILNITNNAIKYTKEGWVDLKVEKTELDGLPFLLFTVEDTGIGIKEEDMPKLFNAFEQLDSASNRKIVGTGLGLAITRLLVNLMNGYIEIKSEYAKGSVFKIYLPLIEGDGSKVSRPEDYVSVIFNDAKVLVVDDNQINLTVATGFLTAHGILPDTASSGPEAIEKVRTNSYDLVFMDHMMPEMDGIEATRIIRSMDGGIFSRLPIVALTANAVIGVTDIFNKAGMNDFLSKPIDAARMNMILTRWLPQEKISNVLSVPAETKVSGNDYSEILAELSQIEGLNVTAGLSHIANNQAAYLSIIKQFCKELDGYTAGISQSLNTADWVNYSIQAHALKGMLANLGADEFSKWASKLETASRNQEYFICQNETESFCQEMKLFRDKLSALKLTNSDNLMEKTAIDAEELRQRLEELKQVCCLGDSDSAEAITEALSKRSFSNEIDAELNEIYDLISSFDFEILPDKIEHILTQI